MSNLYEKQALENYLNDGITQGKKISYGSLGRNKNEIPQQPVNYERQNYERQPIVMNIKSNSMRNSNKTNILQQPDNYDTDNYDTDNFDTDNFDTVNYERQLVVMNIKSNSTKNENNSKMNVTELEDKTKSIILKQKYELFQKLTQEEQMYENIMRNSNETNILQQPVNYEKQPIVINSTKNENTSKMFITELSDKSKSISLKQKHLMFQKLTKEEQICDHILNYWPKHEMNGIK